MENLVEKARRYLEECGSASTAELAEKLLGSVIGNRRLAAEIVVKALKNQSHILRQEGGRWLLRTHAAGEEEKQPIRWLPCNLLLLGKSSLSNPLAGAIIRQEPNGSSARMEISSVWQRGQLVVSTTMGETSDPVQFITSHRLRLFIAEFLADNPLWYIGRRTDLHRWARVLSWPAISEALPLWPAARKLYSLPRAIQCSSLARALHLETPEDSLASAELLAWWGGALIRVLDALAERHLSGPEALREWLQQGNAKVDFSQYAFCSADLSQIPMQPGTYSFWDRSGNLLYIGKAKNLRRRIQSYFQTKSLPRKAERILLKRLYSFEYHSLGSELEALVQENTLIRTMQPLLNTQQEVRAPQAGSFADRASIAVFENPDRQNVLDLWCLCPGHNACHLKLLQTEASRRKVHMKLHRMYFKSQRRRAKSKPDALSKLLAAWLKKKQDSANWIDVARFSSADQLMAQLDAYARDSRQLSSDRVFYFNV